MTIAQTMILGVILSFIGGTIIGSFLNVLILRLPAGKKMNGRSHCVHCKHELAALDLVPLFSFLFLRGKCRYCHKQISRRYFYIELFTGLLFALSFAEVFPSLDIFSSVVFIKALFVCALMLVIFVIDYEHFLILDKVLLWSAGILLVLNLLLDFTAHSFWVNSYTFNALLGGTGLYLFFGAVYYFSNGRWIGFGDVKFAWILGLVLPFPSIIVGVLLAFGIGALVAVVLLALRSKGMQSEVPFGTFLAVASIVTFFYGEQIMRWYFSLLGLRNLI